MGDRHQATIGRRQLLRTGMLGVVATATSDEKRKARFQPNAAEVQTFYRVNRYPKR